MKPGRIAAKSVIVHPDGKGVVLEQTGDDAGDILRARAIGGLVRGVQN